MIRVQSALAVLFCLAGSAVPAGAFYLPVDTVAPLAAADSGAGRGHREGSARGGGQVVLENHGLAVPLSGTVDIRLADHWRAQ